MTLDELIDRLMGESHACQSFHLGYDPRRAMGWSATIAFLDEDRTEHVLSFEGESAGSAMKTLIAEQRLFLTGRRCDELQ